MSTTYNKKKFEQLVSRTPSKWAEKHRAKKEASSWAQNSAMVAINVLTLLEEKKWSQKKLAEVMNISPQQVSKIVKGKVNFTFESIANLEKALGQKIMQIELIDRDRESRDITSVIQWIEKSTNVIISTPSKKHSPKGHTDFKIYSTHTEEIKTKRFNNMVKADENLSPTGS